MRMRSKLNLFAATIIVAGGFALITAPPAEAAFEDGCMKMRKRIMEESTNCGEGGGTYTYSGTCTSTSYTLTSSCS